jgi:hypothetical protein
VTYVSSNISHATVSVGASAVALVDGTPSRRNLIVQNVHASQDLYVGGAGVATSTGLKVIAGASVGFDDFNGPLYGIASGAATDVRVIEIYG